jgi:hypothetical protein
MCGSGNPNKKDITTLCVGAASQFWSLYMGHDGKSPVDGGHFIAIVGYDSDNYYYLDTCAHGQFANVGMLTCRNPGPIDDNQRADMYHGTPYAHVWRIGKANLWQLVAEWPAGGWIQYTGGASRTLASPW